MQSARGTGLQSELAHDANAAATSSGERPATRIAGAHHATRAPDAMGVLSSTPLVHLLVYGVDHLLTGELVVREDGGAEHTISWVDGCVAHVKTASDAAPVVAPRAVEQRVAALVAVLPGETSYAFYAATDGSDGDAGDTHVARELACGACDPLDLLLVAARAWDDAARFDAAMLRLGTDPLALSGVGAAAFDTVALTPLEHTALHAIVEGRATVADLLARHADDADALRRFLYLLAVTRRLVVKPSVKPSAMPLAPRTHDSERAAPPRDSARPAAERADLALQRGDIDAALTEASRAVALAPDDCDAVALHVWISSMKASDADAPSYLAGFDRVLERDPRNENALFYRGKLLARLGRPKEALQTFTLLLYANSEHRGAKSEVRLLQRRGVQ
jgi:tetratricopeptide (TPR) repeat protein